MSRVSKKTREALMNEINSILFYEAGFKGLFTKEIADKLIRDKEFIKDLLLEMEKRGWVRKIGKNKRDYNYMLRRKWVLTEDIRKLFNKDNLEH